MNTSRRFLITFGTDTGRNLTLSVPRADETKSADAIETAMNSILALGVVQNVNGIAQSIAQAKLRTVVRTPVV